MEATLFPFKQEGTQMYVGAMRAEDLIHLGTVAVWHQEDGESSGYQRAPERARIRKVASYLHKDPKPLMPTSVLLSIRGRTLVDEEVLGDEAIVVTIPEDESMWIVDGQHRIHGLQEAIEELGIDRLRDYPVPVVIVEFPDEEEEAHQFQVINETMKKVNTQLARRLLSLRLGDKGAEGKRAVREAGRMWEARSVEVIKSLTEDENSPWFGRIQPPNQRKQPEHVVRELSFSTSLKPILTAFPFKDWEGTRVGDLVRAYWQAWEELASDAFANPEDFVLMKTPGVFSLHLLARYVLEVLRVRGINEPSASDFKNVLIDLGDYAESEYWRSGNINGAAMAGSMSGFKLLAEEFTDRLANAGHTT